MGLLNVLKRLFKSRLPAPTPAPTPAPAPPPAPTQAPIRIDPEADVAVLEALHKRAELDDLRKAVFHDPATNSYGVRVPDGRILYRPTRHEAIDLWYNNHAQQIVSGNVPAVPKKRETVRKTRPPKPEPPKKTRQENHHKTRPIEAIDPKTKEVRHQFNSIRDAELAGFRRSCIDRVLAGQVNTHAGLVWQDRGKRATESALKATPKSEPTPTPAPSPPTTPATQQAAWDLVARLLQRPVEAFDRADSNCIRAAYTDPAAVLGAGLPDALLVLDGQRERAYGLQWRFRGDSPGAKSYKGGANGRGRPIRGTNPQTGQIDRAIAP